MASESEDIVTLLTEQYGDRFTLLKSSVDTQEFSIVFTDPEEVLSCAADFELNRGSQYDFTFTVYDEHLSEPFFCSLPDIRLDTFCQQVEVYLKRLADGYEEQSYELPQIQSEYQQAAEAIFNADIILIATGAGWSADSGLATYPGVAEIPPYQKRNLTYFDLCQPHWMKKDPATFYGFWGDCANVYRETVPHDGYNILKRWKDSFFMKDNPLTDILGAKIKESFPDDDGLDVTEEPFFSLTSNVDAHWWNPETGAVFRKNEVSEVHGNIEFWQTSEDFIGANDHNVWKLDSNFRFEVNKETMLAGDASRWPRDPVSGTLARPCILMFGDWEWAGLDDDRYYQWSTGILKLCRENENLKAVCIEVGCGLRVPTIRHAAERFVRSTGGTLIRINPDPKCLSEVSFREVANIITIKSKGLAAIQKIDEILSTMASVDPEL